MSLITSKAFAVRTLMSDEQLQYVVTVGLEPKYLKLSSIFPLSVNPSSISLSDLSLPSSCSLFYLYPMITLNRPAKRSNRFFLFMPLLPFDLRHLFELIHNSPSPEQSNHSLLEKLKANPVHSFFSP